MSLVQYPAGASAIRGVGVFVLRQPAQRRVRGRTAFRIGFVLEAEWGFSGEWGVPDNDTQILETFFPFGPTQAFKEISGLPVSSRAFYRVAASDAAKAAITLVDTDGADSLTIEAREVGAGGNRIHVTITANADDATKRDVRVYILATDGATIIHDATYRAVQASTGAVTDPDDPWVTMRAASGATKAAAPVAGAALTGGTAGTITASHYQTAFEAAGGISSEIDIIVPIGVSSALVDSVNEALATFLASPAGAGKLGIAATPQGDNKSTAISTVASARARGMRYLWPQIKGSWAYSYAGYSASGVEDMSGAALYAAIVQNLDHPATAAMLGNVPDTWMKAVGLETGFTGLDTSGYADLSDAGIIGWYLRRGMGVLPLNDVSTYLVDGAEPLQGDVQRYADMYLVPAIAERLEAHLGRPLDVVPSQQQIGRECETTVQAVEAFLAAEEAAGRLIAGTNPDGSASPAYDVDPFSLSTDARIASGRWDIGVLARKTSAARAIVLWAGIDTTIEIRAAA